MMFWISCSLLTAAAFIAALMPFLRAENTDVQAQANDIAVYKDQLTEIDADLERGMISKEDAENARTEVSRRLLKADDSAMETTQKPAKWATVVAATALLAIPVIAWGGYVLIGSPGMPDLPVEARGNSKNAVQEIAVLLQKAEEHLKAEPNDAKGWSVIAPIYLRLGRYDDAINAFGNAIRNSAPSLRLQIGLGEALAAANNGVINDAALAAFSKAAEIDPANPEPKALMATALAQQGKLAEAKAAFEKILADAPKDAPWRPNIEAALRDVDVAMNPAAAEAPKGPNQSDIENAAAMSATDRTAMIEGMVAKLDARLAETPNDPQGWQQLIRSYAMLQKSDKARDALQRARTALEANSEALAHIKTLANELGLEQP